MRSSTTKPLAVNRACGAECPGCGEIVDPINKQFKQFIRQIVRLGPSSTTHHECRHCGYGVEEAADKCSQCGSHEIAAYDFE